MRSLFFAAALLIFLSHNAMAQQQSAQGSDILSDMKNAMGDVARDQVRLKTEKHLPDSAEAEGDYTRERGKKRAEAEREAQQKQREFERERDKGVEASRGYGNERAREASGFGRERASEARGRK